ncbi:hypothetical protein Desku_0829 [Desulfofundulus kuznetsovii DSM 6115]|uniref:N-acetyltransferase domain-containing protein n=1 Tax=Desulfofundulus kuznetsovii (strain DSM 6115 / VKM B-1805 / 17) TaxID=760568 RepID=A0AAU8P8C1_DESK7|nr:hypothetical protein Desku_0829 [Desulfofundulus kuznetsovii DSM 6115]
MLKKIMAKWMNLKTEEDLQRAIFNASQKLYHELQEEHKKHLQKSTKNAIELLRWYNPTNLYFVGLLPFMSRKDNFYWILIRFGDQKPETKENYFRDCSIWVLDPCFPTSLNNPQQGRLHFEIKDKEVEITNLVVGNQREGIGSFLLNLLEQLARTLDVKKISGKLSPQDAEIRNIQIAFYEKNGYSVVLNNDEQTGAIWKVLE